MSVDEANRVADGKYKSFQVSRLVSRRKLKSVYNTTAIQAVRGRPQMSWRVKWTRVFLWVSVLAWGIGVGAKLYDLRVLAAAWSAAPPESLTLLPYGPRFPVDPGDFFLPTSALTLVAAVGALISGWKTPLGYRAWLCLSVMLILAVWIFTVVAFWPRNAAL